MREETKSLQEHLEEFKNSWIYTFPKDAGRQLGQSHAGFI